MPNNPTPSSLPEAALSPARTVAVSRPGWRETRIESYRCWYAGDQEPVRHFLAACGRGATAASLAAELHELDGPFALIAEIDDQVVAATDHCRSWPVFHATASEGRAAVSNDADALRRVFGFETIDADALLEARASGYVFDDGTLYRGLRQLRAGEVMVLPADHDGEPERARSFRYLPTLSKERPSGGTETAALHLGRAIDTAIDDVVRYADGAPILVPLSGGLDSRLVVAKLHERGYPDLRTMSYGPPGNTEARAAREVAARLDLPWRYVETGHRATRAFYQSDLRREYARFADGCSSVPNYQDLMALLSLREQGALPRETVVVNGQTGDFISGGHIPSTLANGEDDNLVSQILFRHAALWSSLTEGATGQRLADSIRRNIDGYGLDLAAGEPEVLATAFERWEYENRQAKFIINGQRSYEFLGLRWRLPLWHRAVVDAFAEMPLSLRQEQSLYRKVLQDWNYRDLFRGFSPVLPAWRPSHGAVIVPLSLSLRVLLGRRRRDRLMTYARYLDRYGNHYCAHGWRTFFRHAPDIRNPAALYTRAWLRERGAQIGEGRGNGT